MLEIAIDNGQGAIVGNMVLEILSAEKFPTVICTQYWKVVAHRPVVDDDIIIVGPEGIAMLTAIIYYGLIPQPSFWWTVMSNC